MEFSEADQARFWAKVAVRAATDCWNWQATTSGGYGRFYHGGKTHQAHRVSCHLVGKTIPAHLVGDHLCRNQLCVNPDHIEAVTMAENTRRGIAVIRWREKTSKQTHCRHGHEYTPDNTVRNKFGRKGCRECRRTADRERKRQINGLSVTGPAINKVKINAEECRALSSQGWSYSRLAARYQVNQASIGKVVAGRKDRKSSTGSRGGQ